MGFSSLSSLPLLVLLFLLLLPSKLLQLAFVELLVFIEQICGLLLLLHERHFSELSEKVFGD